jgi:hypothetical protein
VPHGFEAFAAIDWSGAAVARPPGLALALAESGASAPRLIAPPGGWSRAALLDWIAARCAARERILIGIDLSAGFPFADERAYFPGWAESPADAPALWALVDRLCASEPHLAANSFVAHAEAARHFRLPGRLGDLHPPGRGRLRETEHGQRMAGLNPYSCFNLVGAAQVGKSSLTGMRVLHRLRGTVPVWPFDPVPASGPVIVEIYTSLAAREAGLRRGLSKLRSAEALDAALAAYRTRPHTPLDRYSDHAADAILTAAWLRHVADDPARWTPCGLSPALSATEGWTFGVTSR